MRLVWTLPAQDDRRNIRDYIAQNNPEAAITLDKLFSDKARRLIDFPDLAPAGRVAGTRELVTHKNYKLVYDVVGDQVRILRILHATQQWPK